MNRKLTIVECPRDAMQGLAEQISTTDKVKLHSALITAGFSILDFGSYVSPKAIPQMADTQEVLELLQPDNTKLLAIVANLRGAETAAQQSKISILGYPLSISETFQQRNSNKSIVESLEELVQIVELTKQYNKELVVYLSMAFGNPYNDPYSIAMVNEFAGVLVALGIETIAISDTVGLASADEVSNLFNSLSNANPMVEWGLHLHARPDNTDEKLRSALNAGCRRIDGAVLGFGGCPMAKDDLVGNINTRSIIKIAEELQLEHGIDLAKFQIAEDMARKIFN